MTANLANAAVNLGEAAGDSYQGIENLTGGAYRDVLIGDAGANVLKGGGDMDVLRGFGGADTLDGGDGRDTASYTGAAVGIVASLGDASLNTGDAAGDIYISIEGIIGSRFDDTLTGGAGDDGLAGDNGDDVLEGGAGADQMDGGGGLDTASYAHATASVTASLTQPFLVNTGEAAGDSYLDIENLTGSANADTLTGNVFANTLDGGAGADTLDGGGGLDTLRGGAGDDTYLVDEAGDRVIEVVGGGTDMVLTSIAYTLKSGQEIEVLATTDDAGTAAIDLVGNAFANILRGNAGANTLTGGIGDTLLGLGGGDRLILTAIPARVDGGLGADKLIVRGGGSVILTDADFAGIEQVYVSNDTSLDMTGVTVGAIITSQSAAGHHATITGTAGANRIVAGKGGDTLDGWAGSDKLFVGAGDDTLHFATAYGRDVIYRFETAHDTLDLSALASDRADLAITAVHGGADTQITIVGDTDPAQKIILVDVNAAQLIANGHFLFGA